MFFKPLVALVTFLVVAKALPNVTRSGRYLYTPDGNRFYIKGIAYQPQGQEVSNANSPFSEPDTFIDPLADSAGCSRDLPNLQSLGVNAIRVYSVDSTRNHDSCMSALSKAGIYTIIDLSLPSNGSIDRASPAWSTNLLDEYINTINVFNKYDNVLAYNVGNEVVTFNLTFISPYVKAAARDIKAYLTSIGSSALVGYAAINGASDFRLPLANFLSCDPSGTNSGSTSIDLYGLNNYAWCGNSTFQASYASIDADYAGYNVAAYFSEYGCITSPPRLWTEVVALFSDQMTPIWSGGVAFSYFPATSDQGQFGMVTLSSDNTTATPTADFNRLQSQYSQVTFVNSPSLGSSSATYPSCPTSNDTFFSSTTLPPTPSDKACNCLEQSLSCRFTPVTSNFNVEVGQLIDAACNFLGQKGASCDAIGGGNGTYGLVSSCDPTIKLSFVMSEWYELNNRDPQACSFSGNGTVNSSAASAATAAASSCIASASATFVPSAPTTTASSIAGSQTTSSGNNGGSNKGSGALPEQNVVMSILLLSIIASLSAIWTLT